MRAIQFDQTGGPEVLKLVEVPEPEPKPGQARVRHEAIGVNFIDTYHRTGLYPVRLPCIPGGEAAGVVEAVGEGVTRMKPGDRVAYSGGFGAYAEKNVVAADRAVKIPEGIDARTAAASLLKGMTVEALIRRTYPVKAGETILVHAAAGGVGQILSQWAKYLGATVIGTVGSEEKAALAKKAGCKHVIVTSKEDFVARVKEITKGKGVPVVYDGVGKDTFMGSLDCLAPRGYMVSFGNASGAVTQFNPGLLAAKGSLFLTRPTLFNYTATREDLAAAARDLFAVVKKKVVKISINQTYPLREAAQAHRDLEARKTTGSTILLP
jgi:NADPH2:quinone reductase